MGLLELLLEEENTEATEAYTVSTGVKLYNQKWRHYFI